ncbi:hypothetical protein LX32DRAFT_263484 [Colletotrichum zoysiae]|uniref:Uncharacterized protein n=1 Tax=Colletotrichum zoysiae TaxID=1216348 RepID=A0AAD9HPH2_9PEZI|nr:hypothetical protein LX32DRAFT_263484 [Colletotrichum zoysiae]
MGFRALGLRHAAGKPHSILVMAECDGLLLAWACQLNAHKGFEMSGEAQHVRELGLWTQLTMTFRLFFSPCNVLPIYSDVTGNSCGTSCACTISWELLQANRQFSRCPEAEPLLDSLTTRHLLFRKVYTTWRRAILCLGMNEYRRNLAYSDIGHGNLNWMYLLEPW